MSWIRTFYVLAEASNFRRHLLVKIILKLWCDPFRINSLVWFAVYYFNACKFADLLECDDAEIRSMGWGEGRDTIAGRVPCVREWIHKSFCIHYKCIQFCYIFSSLCLIRTKNKKKNNCVFIQNIFFFARNIMSAIFFSFAPLFLRE